MSSKGDLVPINMYNRGNNEFVLVFDKEIDMGIYQVLIIIPSQKIIGLPEGGKNSYIELSNKFLYQKRKAKQFTLIGTAYFEKNEIFNVEFENQNEIRFESSLPSLKNYGKNFVLKWEK
ncbi:MAG TPA: hypothetical protein VLZ83_10955 [Edaphocola sp.]|nr:hypothetical protein [Edaphocola sp.]